MRGEDLIREHKAVTDAMHQTCKAKNADYAGQAGGEDGFANFRLVETLSKGAVLTEVGMFTRMSDKWARVANLLFSGKAAAVKTESLEDTLLDLANYCILLVIWLRQKSAPDTVWVRENGVTTKTPPPPPLLETTGWSAGKGHKP